MPPKKSHPPLKGRSSAAEAMEFLKGNKLMVPQTVKSTLNQRPRWCCSVTLRSTSAQHGDKEAKLRVRSPTVDRFSGGNPRRESSKAGRSYTHWRATASHVTLPDIQQPNVGPSGYPPAVLLRAPSPAPLRSRDLGLRAPATSAQQGGLAPSAASADPLRLIYH